MHDLFNDPAFRLYSACAAILVIKMWITGNGTGLLRVIRKNYISGEDYTMVGSAPKPPDEQIERLRRAHQNDLENILPFLVIGFLYVLSGPSYSVARGLLVVFTISRVLHTIAYALGLQPWRTIIFEFGNVSLVATAVLLLVNLAA